MVDESVWPDLAKMHRSEQAARLHHDLHDSNADFDLLTLQPKYKDVDNNTETGVDDRPSVVHDSSVGYHIITLEDTCVLPTHSADIWRLKNQPKDPSEVKPHYIPQANLSRSGHDPVTMQPLTARGRKFEHKRWLEKRIHPRCPPDYLLKWTRGPNMDHEEKERRYMRETQSGAARPATSLGITRPTTPQETPARPFTPLAHTTPAATLSSSCDFQSVPKSVTLGPDGLSMNRRKKEVQMSRLQDRAPGLQVHVDSDAMQKLSEKVTDERGKKHFAAFQRFDKKASGFVSHNEFKQALQYLGMNLNQYQEDRMLHMADRRKTGKVDYVDFVKRMQAKENYYDGESRSPYEYGTSPAPLLGKKLDTFWKDMPPAEKKLNNFEKALTGDAPRRIMPDNPSYIHKDIFQPRAEANPSWQSEPERFMTMNMTSENPGAAKQALAKERHKNHMLRTQNNEARVLDSYEREAREKRERLEARVRSYQEQKRWYLQHSTVDVVCPFSNS
eukprot:Rmarinus@m.27546